MNVLNFDAKVCERIRRQLDPYLSNELLVETTSEVSRHLESCTACSAELESRLRVREALRKAVSKQLPPDDLSRMVHQRLVSARQGSFWRPRGPVAWSIAVAAMVLVTVAGQEGLRIRRERQVVSSVLSLGVGDHLQCAVQAHNYPEVANPPDQLRKQLGVRYAGLLPVVQAQLSGFQILEAHICSVSGDPRAYVHFIARGQGTVLSVILTKRGGDSLPTGPTGRFLATSARGGVDLYGARLEGFSVAGFESGECFGFVVCDLSQDKVLQVAAAVAPAVRAAMETASSAPGFGSPPALAITSQSNEAPD